jgi:hypothetical protein
VARIAIVLAVVTLAGLARADTAPRKTVAVLEYRAGSRGAIGIGERLARLLSANAAFDVIDPQDARRRGGSRIDGEVARCGGEAQCVGALGERLGASEVLLVGVSQLGDVVLALQRIDARKREAGGRLAEALAPGKEPTDEEVLGWLRQLYPPEAFRRWGNIQVMADVDGAEVSLNGQAEGRTPIGHPLQMRAPATYRVRLDKNGYVPFQARIDLLPDASVEVRATLVREAQPVAWYKRWYVWAAIGGALAVTGGALALYYGTRVDETPQGFIATMPHPSPPP